MPTARSSPRSARVSTDCPSPSSSPRRGSPCRPPREILDGLSDLSGLRTSDRTRAEPPSNDGRPPRLELPAARPDEQTALRRFSLFGTSFTIAAARTCRRRRRDRDQTTCQSSCGPSSTSPWWSLICRRMRRATACSRRSAPSAAATSTQKAKSTRSPASLASWALDTMGPWRRLDLDWIDAVGVELDNLRALVGLRPVVMSRLAQQLACTIGRYHDARTHTERAQTS